MPHKRAKQSAQNTAMVKAAVGLLRRIGAGATGVAAQLTPEAWSRKLQELQDRAAAGDSGASDILSMIGVASMVTGAGVGLGTSRLLGGDSAGSQLLGAGLGTAIGAAPGLFAGGDDADEKVLLPGLGGETTDVMERAMPKTKGFK